MSEPVPSPCVGICALNPASICTGCGRHIDEIAGWSQFAESTRRRVFNEARARLAELRGAADPKESKI